MSSPPVPSDDELNALLDKLLSPAARAQVEIALVAHPDVAQRLADLQRVMTQLDQFKHAALPTPSRDLSGDILRAIQNEAQANSSNPQPEPALSHRLTARRPVMLTLGLQAIIALVGVVALAWQSIPFVQHLSLTALATSLLSIQDWIRRLFTVELAPSPTRLTNWSIIDMGQASPLWAIGFVIVALLWFIGNGILLRPQFFLRLSRRFSHD